MNDSNLPSSLNVSKRPCTAVGCERPVLAKELCGAHYQRKYKWKRPADMPYKHFCSVDGCEKPHIAKGLCTLHYARLQAHGDVTVTHRYDSRPKDPVYCSVADCIKRHAARGYCHKHYVRFIRFGNPLINSKMMGIGDTPEQRFWSRVALTANPDKCWEWQGTADMKGYGYCSWHGRTRLTHRIAYEIVNGKVPTLHVLHSCDNPSCCNPRHLREGTDADNHADMGLRGRRLMGEQLHSSKLTNETVLWIRSEWEQGRTQTDIAEEIGMSRVAVGRVVKRQSWKHI